MAWSDERLSNDSIRETGPHAAVATDWDSELEAIKQSIYDKHKLRKDADLATALQWIELVSGGAEPSAWANPEERAAARAAYAAEGSGPADVERRWKDSEYLLDPRTYDYMQKYGRDVDFLLGMIDKNAYKPDLIKRYNASNGERLYRRGMFNGKMVDPDGAHGYQRWSGAGLGLADALTNPDTALGEYIGISETVPNFLRMQGSGETKTAGESWRAAQAARMANARYRITSPAPILDLPAGASPEDIGRRIAELRNETARASIPFGEERWQRTAGFTPPGWLSDVGDITMSMADPTILVPAAKAVGTAGAVTKAVVKGASVAGKGWVAPIVRNALTHRAAEFGGDLLSEHILGHPVQGLLGGLGGRTWRQWAGGRGTPAKDFQYKTDEELVDAKRLREEQYRRLSADRSIEMANDEAYNNLINSHALPGPVERERADRQWRPKY